MDSSGSERDTVAPAPSNELQGWKEIAAYLGKSVRAAQRWEQELGLPVHRLRTTAGQSIFARRSEIDAWRARQEVPAAATADEPPADEPKTAGRADSTAPANRWSTRHAAVAAVTLVVLIAVAIAFLGRQSNAASASDVVAYRFTDTALVAETSAGQVLWRHVFPHPVLTVRPVGQGSMSFPNERIQAVDLDGDGVREVLAVVSTPQRDRIDSDALYCFSNTGTVRWVYRPDLTTRFAAGEFAPPWLITALAVSPEPSPSIYIAISHYSWWPSVLLRIDASGRAERRFTQSGQTYAIAFWQFGGIRHIVSGGINNEYGSAAVAVLREDGPEAHSPQTAGSKYECRDCGRDVPLRYFLLAPMEVSVAGDAPYNRVAALQVAGTTLQGTTQEAPNIPGADALFRIGADLVPVEVNPGDGYWRVHQHLEEAGRLHHHASDCPERAGKIRIFDPAGGWHEQDLRFTAPMPGSAK